MRLEKFIVKEIKEDKKILELFSICDWEHKHPEKRKQYTYEILGENGITYFYSKWKTSAKIKVGQTIKCLVENLNAMGAKEDHWGIRYDKRYLKDGFFSENDWVLALRDFIGRKEEDIKFSTKEIERLNSIK
jgi:hypothetical protein